MNVQGHIRQAQRFEGFLDRVRSEPFPEWVVITRFYVALHYVDAVLASRLGAHHGGGHGGRRDRMRRVPETAAVLTEYHQLEKLSKEARYHGTTFSDLALELDRALYERVRGAMRTALGMPT